VTGVGGLGKVGDRRLGLRMRVRVIEANDLEAALPGRPPRIDVALRIQVVPAGVIREITSPDGLDDLAGDAQQDAAALGGQGLTRVRGDLDDHGARESNGSRYNVSTAIAIPMPPPMHSAATPYRSFLARSA
jgi:hypothetical protein